MFRLLQDHLESYLAGGSRDGVTHPAVVEKSFRSFLECGIHRFGVVRFRCPGCGDSLFVAFSCKRRGACPSCDGKRAAITASHALDALLPDVGYRQWVLVVPKRLRYFIHRYPALAGEASRILARELELFYRRKLSLGRTRAAPAQIHFIQRFGSTLNLHLHIHAVVSDGLFNKAGSELAFIAMPPPTEAELAAMAQSLRRKLLLRFLRLRIVEQELVEEMSAWEHSGFSLHAATAIAAGDRQALERLLYYCARPALSTKRLTYKKDQGMATYEAVDKRSGRSLRLAFPAVEFISRVARLIPPPRRNVVRYYGALGPNSPLRPLLTRESLARSNPGLLVKTGQAFQTAAKAMSASARAWARLLSRVFEVNPLICLKCGETMEPVAAILKDGSLVRLMDYLGLPPDYPKLAPARSPPEAEAEESQVDPLESLFSSIDWVPPDDPPAATEEIDDA